MPLSELALQEARRQTKLAHDSRDPGETRRVAEEINTLKASVERRELELTEATIEANDLRESAKRRTDVALVEARKEWEAAESMFGRTQRPGAPVGPEFSTPCGTPFGTPPPQGKEAESGHVNGHGAR